MGARVIDEGVMDEKSSMNFSEYMAILSGNTDLLEKAKIEKKIVLLEGERKSFNKIKANAEFTLNGIQKEYDNNCVIIDCMTVDYNKFLAVTKTDKDGNRLNLIKLEDFLSIDEKTIGKKLQKIAKNATTGGQCVRVGELYRFPIKVISETSLASGLAAIENRFVIEGHYKYTFNNGHLVMADPKAAVTNFLNALARGIPQMQEIADKV